MRCKRLRKHTKSRLHLPSINTLQDHFINMTRVSVIQIQTFSLIPSVVKKNKIPFLEFGLTGHKVCKKYKYLEVEPVLLITLHSLLAILDFHKQKEQASHAADLLWGGETVFIILYWLLAYEKTKDPTFPPPCGWSLLPSS